MIAFKLLLGLLSFLQPIAEVPSDVVESRPRYHHVILSEWKSDTTAEDVASIEELFVALKEKVKGLDKVRFRKVGNSRFQHEVTLIFSNKEALQAYEKHPLHQELITIAKEQVASFETYSYWE